MPKNTLTITYSGRKKRPKNKANKSSTGKAPVQTNPCCFCHSYQDREEEFGKLIKKNGFTVHYFCLLFSSGLCQRGRTDKEGIFGFLTKDIDKELTRGSKLRCEYCKLIGATIGCVVPSCRKKFHFICGKEKGSLHQFYDTFRSYCPEHRPQQSFVRDSNSKKTATCPICITTVTASCSVDTLKSNCCKNSWFHRNCIQRYALSAALHFFKCPMCNNKEKFQQEMLEFGIYIPDQDAAWEKEPNAFNELLERHSLCDAKVCNCPMGRDGDSSSGRWELLLCANCGSIGSHLGCDGLVPVKKSRERICVDCWDVVQKLEAEKNSVKRKSTEKATKPLTKKHVNLTQAQKARQIRELKTRENRDKTTVNITNHDSESDVDVNVDDDGLTKTSSSPSQARKRQRLNRRTEQSGNNSLVSANITVTDDSHGHSVTATISRSSSRSSNASVASSNVSAGYFPEFSQSLEYQNSVISDVEVSDSDSNSSEGYSINTVTDLPQRKALTISWRGRKVHITNPNTEEKHKSLDWSLQLQMSEKNPIPSVSGGSSLSHSGSSSISGSTVTSRRSSDSSLTRTTRSGTSWARLSSDDDDNDEIYRLSPPVLVPVDDEVSILCKSPPVLSPNINWEKDVLGSSSSKSPNRRSVNKNLSNQFQDIRPSTSTESIISISSSDSETESKKKRNKYLSRSKSKSQEVVDSANVVDLTEHDLPSTIRLIPRYLTRPPISRPVIMEPEVVILD